jgi:hypothetical protein
MEFFCYHRDRPGSAALRGELLEEHWSYMDRFTMIARGPTMDGDTPTRSVHVVDLPDPAAAPAVTGTWSSASAPGNRPTSTCRPDGTS